MSTRRIAIRTNKRGKVCIRIRQREIRLPRSAVILDAAVKQRRLWPPPLVALLNIPRENGKSLGTLGSAPIPGSSLRSDFAIARGRLWQMAPQILEMQC